MTANREFFKFSPNFQASNYLLWLYRPVCVGCGWKPRRPLFSRRGSNVSAHMTHGHLYQHTYLTVLALPERKTFFQMTIIIITWFLVQWYNMDFFIFCCAIVQCKCYMFCSYCHRIRNVFSCLLATERQNHSTLDNFLLFTRLIRKPTMWFSNRSETNRYVLALKMAIDWKFWI